MRRSRATSTVVLLSYSRMYQVYILFILFLFYFIPYYYYYYLPGHFQHDGDTQQIRGYTLGSTPSLPTYPGTSCLLVVFSWRVGSNPPFFLSSLVEFRQIFLEFFISHVKHLFPRGSRGSSFSLPHRIQKRRTQTRLMRLELGIFNVVVDKYVCLVFRTIILYL